MSDKPKIFWSLEEKLSLVRWGVAHYREGVQETHKRYNEAQIACLPIERRRPFDPAAQSAWNKSVLQQLGLASPIKRTRVSKAGPMVVPNVPTVEQSPPPPGTGISGTAPIEIKALEPPKVVEVPLVVVEQPKTLEGLLEEIVLRALDNPRIANAVIGIVGHHFRINDPVTGEETQQSNKVVIRTKERLPKVLIVARLQGSAKTRLSSALNSLLDLSFWSTDQSLQELKNKVVGKDAVVVQTDNVSHSAKEIVKVRASHYIEVTGGQDSLKSTLLKLSEIT